MSMVLKSKANVSRMDKYGGTLSFAPNFDQVAMSSNKNQPPSPQLSPKSSKKSPARLQSLLTTPRIDGEVQITNPDMNIKSTTSTKILNPKLPEANAQQFKIQTNKYKIPKIDTVPDNEYLENSTLGSPFFPSTKRNLMQKFEFWSEA